MTLNCPWGPKNKMSSMRFMIAKQILRRLDKQKNQMINLGQPENIIEDAIFAAEESELYNYRRGIQMMKKLIEIEKEELGDSTNENITKSYFITIRPKPEIEWNTFYNTIEKLIQRKKFIKCTYSYEQAGKTNDEIGKGFHVHIICTTEWRSVQEAVRDTFSTCQHIAERQCIDVQKIWNQTQWNQKLAYIQNYESSDDHKILTKEMDQIWREKNNLMPLYYKGSTDALPVSSPGQGVSITEIDINTHLP